MHVSIWNVILQIVNFLLLAWLLQRFVFKPVRSVLEKRQSAIDAALEQAETRRAEAEREAQAYREKARELAGAADEARQRALALAEREAQTLREEAARTAKAEIEAAKRSVESEREQALRILEARAADLGVEIARRLLDDLHPGSDASFLSDIIASVDGLDQNAKAALGRQAASASVELVSARALEPLARERFESWLSGLAGVRVRAVYRVDGTLIAGVELRWPTGVFSSHLRASLDRIRRELGSDAAAA